MLSNNKILLILIIEKCVLKQITFKKNFFNQYWEYICYTKKLKTHFRKWITKHFWLILKLNLLNSSLFGGNLGVYSMTGAEQVLSRRGPGCYWLAAVAHFFFCRKVSHHTTQRRRRKNKTIIIDHDYFLFFFGNVKSRTKIVN